MGVIIFPYYYLKSIKMNIDVNYKPRIKLAVAASFIIALFDKFSFFLYLKYEEKN